MMSLDETILHCQERATIDCSECAKEHLQLSEWLEELKILRKKQTQMKVKEIHVDEYYCPACGSENCCDQKRVLDNYCPVCGQRIYQELMEG